MAYSELPENPDVVYKDKYVTLHRNKIVINHYYFPIGKKTLNFNEIRRVQDATALPFLLSKTWGMSVDFTVWWAAGRRSAAGNEGIGKVILWTAEGNFAGFNVGNIGAFIRQCQALELTVFTSDKAPSVSDKGQKSKKNVE
ncbi:hypothetical protein KIPB_002617 [Kipferlia bialata]|uniref:Uncharacterized protein n=1 Tax=Kipferlia bialata TaxID=797122 RepID=A0A9K3GGE3_9EUKA|nr:hypothetical protein KIPB_001554 [Kipferlia bialata]GIQ81630.1 hypothetical protein KIPB_002617 [Kipferlia bialata]|eukprot:g1554.t1